MGETAHHNALLATQRGQTLITVFHSNSERQFLKDRLEPRLRASLRTEVPGAKVVVSESDKDPFEVVDVHNM